MQSGARRVDGAMDRDLIERFLVQCEGAITDASRRRAQL
jgi:hypothetical protein